VTIRRDGRLRLEVRGLIIPELGTAGPVNTVSASLACANESPAEQTQTVPLSQSGDATIKAHLNLPGTCLGPRVFVNPNGIAGAYIALSGWRPLMRRRAPGGTWVSVSPQNKRRPDAPRSRGPATGFGGPPRWPGLRGHTRVKRWALDVVA